MPGLAVVQGCTLMVAGAPEATCTIVTPPSTKVMLGGAPAYSGPLTVQIAGAIMGGVFSATPGTGTATIAPTCVTMVDGKPAITNDCIGQGMLSGAAAGSPPVPVTAPCTVQIINAGQQIVSITK